MPHGIDAVVEVLAEPALADRCGKIAVRRAHDAAMKLHQLFAANTVKLPGLNQPQQLGLQLGRQFRHLV